MSLEDLEVGGFRRSRNDKRIRIMALCTIAEPGYGALHVSGCRKTRVLEATRGWLARQPRLVIRHSGSQIADSSNPPNHPRHEQHHKSPHGKYFAQLKQK